MTHTFPTRRASDSGSVAGEASLSAEGLIYSYQRQQLLLQADCALYPDGEGWQGVLSVDAGGSDGICLSVSLEQDVPHVNVPIESVPIQIVAPLKAWCDWHAARDCHASARAEIVCMSVGRRVGKERVGTSSDWWVPDN